MDNKYLSIFVVGIAVLAVAIAGCTTSPPAATEIPLGEGAPVYIVGIVVPYPPFSTMDAGATPAGFDVEALRWIAEDQGMEVTFSAIAGNDRISALEAGEIDIACSGMTVTKEGKKKVAFSEPYLTANQMVVARSGSGVTLEDIAAGTAVVGTPSGSTAAVWIEEKLVDTGIMPVEKMRVYGDAALAVDDLEEGRIDAAVYDDLFMQEIIEGRNVAIIGFIETNTRYAFAVRPEDADLLALLNTGLSHLMADPSWDELKATYHIAP
ncbi:MAG TPA: amino acid ABC transporter substrate-binding protein [Methanoculleus sp.]|nr:amino acid ABC transporter substrate-binding protein [Methanoculleus sp.]